MSDLVETMFSARLVPWHRLGNVTEDELPMEEAIIMAGLDWLVESAPVFTLHNGAMRPVADKIAAVRNTDSRVLGVHGKSYRIFQNHELFAFVEAVLDTGEVVYDTAGSLKQGQVVWATVKLPEEITVNGDRHDAWLLLASSHDGSMAITAAIVLVRVVCWNTLNFALKGAVSSFKIKHTVSAPARVAEAKAALGLSYQYLDGFTAEVEKLMDQAVTDAAFDGIVRNLFPTHPAQTKRQEDAVKRRRLTVERVYADPLTIGEYRGTGWGALNAVNEWEQWSTRAIDSRITRKGMAEKQMQRLLTGTMPFTRQAHDILVAAR